MAYRMTPKRKAALRKAQLASARKRRGKGKGKLASANRKNSRMKRRVALVAATGGLLGGAIGVAGAYYARKIAGGGPKAPKMSHSNSSRASLERSVQQLSSNVGRVERQLRGAGRVGAPRSKSLKAVGYAFSTQNYWSRKPSSPSTTRNLLQVGKASGPVPIPTTKGSGKTQKMPYVKPQKITGLARHRMADRANRKRGLDGYIPSKAKFDRRRTKAQRKKYPRV